jgi:hypothetical protein
MGENSAESGRVSIRYGLWVAQMSTRRVVQLPSGRAFASPEQSASRHAPVPIVAAGKSGRTSTPHLPQAVQVNSVSRSDSRTSSPQRPALMCVEWLQRWSAQNTIRLCAPEARIVPRVIFCGRVTMPVAILG